VAAHAVLDVKVRQETLDPFALAGLHELLSQRVRA
jgi:hypothetical protein